MTVAVSIRGGRRLRRFVFDAQAIFRAAVLAALRDVIRREILPQLRQALPRRTGRLRRETVVVVRRGGIEIRGPFYGHFQRIGPNRRDTIAETAVRLIEDAKDRIRTLVRAELRRRLP